MCAYYRCVSDSKMHAMLYGEMTYRVRVSDRICTCEQELSRRLHNAIFFVVLMLKMTWHKVCIWIECRNYCSDLERGIFRL